MVSVITYQMLKHELRIFSVIMFSSRDVVEGSVWMGRTDCVGVMDGDCSCGILELHGQPYVSHGGAAHPTAHPDPQRPA